MAYVRLNDKTNTGHGFITHEDWKLLSFECSGNIVKLTGDKQAGLLWAERVGGVIIKDTDAVTELKAKQYAALQNEITETQTKLTVLTAAKAALGTM